jgi:hypothetical protein
MFRLLKTYYYFWLLLLGYFGVRNDTGGGLFAEKVFLNFVDVIRMFPMHPGEMLLNVVSPVELFVTYVAYKRLVVPGRNNNKKLI